jgi:hypothetical protein
MTQETLDKMLSEFQENGERTKTVLPRFPFSERADGGKRPTARPIALAGRVKLTLRRSVRKPPFPSRNVINIKAHNKRIT